jgi:hypothetical protein
MSSSNRNVRLGIVYRGSIIGEEIIDRRIDVSVGVRTDSTIQFSPNDYPDFPEYTDILCCEQNRYYLVIPQDPNARVNLRGASTTDDAVTIKGKRCVAIDEVAGGSLVVGDLTVMFQFIRGYSVPTKTTERTVLRLGMVFNERLISDRIFPDEKSVSIGGDKADSVVLDSVDYTGPSLKFVNNKDGSVTLNIPQEIAVKVALEGDAPRDISELISKGKAKKDGAGSICHLPLGTRGRASMGPYTVLFQVVKQRIVVPTMEKQNVARWFVGLFLNDLVWITSFLVWTLVAGGIFWQALAFNASTGKYFYKTKEEVH